MGWRKAVGWKQGEKILLSLKRQGWIARFHRTKKEFCFDERAHGDLILGLRPLLASSACFW